MFWVERLYIYLEYWWRTPIYWNRLFTDTRDAYLLFSVFTFSFYSLAFFLDSSFYYLRTILNVFFFLNGIVFQVLLWDWIRRKGRILFPRMTLLHENQRFGLAWEVPENPQNLQVPRLNPQFREFLGMPISMFRLPIHQRAPPRSPFVPDHLEYRQIQAQIYSRSRTTDRPSSQHESGFSYRSTLEPTREHDYSQSLQFPSSEKQIPRQSNRIPDYKKHSLGESFKDNTQQSNVISGQNIRTEVNAHMEDTSQQIKSPYDLINFGGSRNSRSRDDYDYELLEVSPRFPTNSLGISFVEKEPSYDSSLGIPNSTWFVKTLEKDGGNESDGRGFSSSSSRKSNESPPESSVGQESDSRSDRSASKKKRTIVPLSVVKLDAACEMFEIPDRFHLIERKTKTQSEGKTKKQSASHLNQSSLEMHERFRFVKRTKNASVLETSFSEICEQEDLFRTAQVSKLEACSSPKGNISRSSKESSVLHTLLHNLQGTTGKTKKMSGDKESSRTPKTKSISSTSEQTKRISSSPEKTKRSCRPQKTKRTTSPVKR